MERVNNLVQASQPVPAQPKPASRSKTLIIGIAIGAGLMVCACWL